MSRIFFYELKRVLMSWIFLAMLIVDSVFSWYVLTTDIIMGIADTAPFSMWSYSTYIGKILPILLLCVLLILADYYGKKQKQAESLILASPISPGQLLLIRSSVLGVCFAILCIVTVGISVCFYTHFLPITISVFTCFRCC